MTGEPKFHAGRPAPEHPSTRPVASRTRVACETRSAARTACAHRRSGSRSPSSASRISRGRTRGRPRPRAPKACAMRAAPTGAPRRSSAPDSRRRRGDGRRGTELGERLPPVGRVHQHAQADDRVERPVGEIEAVRIALHERHRCPARAARRRATASISADASTPVTWRPGAAARSPRGRCRCRRRGSSCPSSGDEESGDDLLLRFGEQPADRSAEPSRLEGLRHRGSA